MLFLCITATAWKVALWSQSLEKSLTHTMEEIERKLFQAWAHGHDQM